MPSDRLNILTGSSPDEPDPRLNIREELAGEWGTELLFLNDQKASKFSE